MLRLKRHSDKSWYLGRGANVECDGSISAEILQILHNAHPQDTGADNACRRTSRRNNASVGVADDGRLGWSLDHHDSLVPHGFSVSTVWGIGASAVGFHVCATLHAGRCAIWSSLVAPYIPESVESWASLVPTRTACCTTPALGVLLGT